MKTASITQTKNRLSAIIDEVRRGETVLILDRGTPVARLVPVSTESSDASLGRIERLERAGLVRRADQAPPRTEISPVKLPAGQSVLRALLREREQGR